MKHDPLCPYKPAILGTAGTGKYVTMVQGQPPVGCQCDLIARVREDEQDKQYEAQSENWCKGYAAALRDAVKVIHDYRADPAAPEGTVYVSDVVAAIEVLSHE